MATDPRSFSPDGTQTLAERLERGELICFPHAPFDLPRGDDREFLCGLRLAALSKNISFDPSSGCVSGFVPGDPDRRARLRGLFAAFSGRVTRWLSEVLPSYRAGCLPDRATFRSEEEATRRLRLTARNDLVHIDAFPSRPSHGRRLLRVYANLNPTEPRVWVTSEPFARLLERYGVESGLLGRQRGWLGHVGEGVLGIFRPGKPARSAYDLFMQQFHDFLKRHEPFQERAPKRLWSFPPGSAWMAMTDACSHAVLRGRFALEHSFFVEPRVLALPDEAPEALLRCAAADRKSSRVA